MLYGSFVDRLKFNCISMPVTFIMLLVIMLFSSLFPAAVQCENGLLFYLSGEQDFIADVAQGDPEPTFLFQVDSIPDGARGSGFQCGGKQLFAYDAPKNIYAERGTLAFYWRSREPVGDAPFHIFRVSYSDHSSWDLVWLRIDYNGNGFDAFVTDANLARPRISYTIPERPEPDRWMHFALTWDETKGIRFYLDGKLVGQKDTTAVFYAGLDQFGPHSRIISPYQVQSLYNYERGGDIDEICIFDQMLSDGMIARLAQGESPTSLKTEPFVRKLSNNVFRDEWWLRYGWNRANDIPPYLAAQSTIVRKVGIHDVYDLKQWMWKGTDGIRETTWPYVYNRSRIPGRSDYFLLPDWNCYSLSGKEVTFFMPDEPWNHIEIAGAAFGPVSLLTFSKEEQKDKEHSLFERPADQERTFHRIDEPVKGGKIRLKNVLQEAPIGEFMAYYVHSGDVPVGIQNLTYTLTGNTEPDNPTLDDLVNYINGRFMPDESQIMLALPRGAHRTPIKTTIENPLPLVHILIPFEFRKGRLQRRYSRFSYTWENIYGGLDGIALDIPPLEVKPTHGDFFPLNIQIKDPIWPDRNLFDFTFSVKPGEAKTIWMDTSDRILPNDYSLYLTIAGAGSDFGPASLEGSRLRLVFKDRKEATQEHELDRFTQVKDNVGNFVEEHPNIKKFRMYDRYSRDITDLLRVNPDHEQGRMYWSRSNSEQGWPDFEQPKEPRDVPLWAFRQIENLKLVKHFITWWIDDRQIENGEFGGGLSDDGDMTNAWPGPALMGVEPEKFTDSVLREMEAFYENEMFTNGLSTIVTDELHTYEEGINVLPQTMLLDYGDPKVVERLMVTAKAYERITGINDLGKRQIKSSFYGGNTIYSEGVWAIAKAYSYLVLQPGLVLVEFNGHPAAKKLLLEIADGVIALRKKDDNGNYYIPRDILYPSGEGRGRGFGANAHLLWAAWRWTGDKKYLQPLLDANYGILNTINSNMLDLTGKRKSWGKEIAARATPHSGSSLNRHIAWQVTGDKQYLEECYADQIQSASQRMYYNTEGHAWSDRVGVTSSELQRARLGGLALRRSAIYPGHFVSWKFKAPATGESVAILIPDATPEAMTIIVFNIEDIPVTATMTGWDIDPGNWEVTEGIDTNDDDKADSISQKRKLPFERTGNIEFTFPPKKTTVITLKLTSKGKPYWKRPDLGIGTDDVTVRGNSVRVTIHSLGSVDAPKSTVALVDTSGKTVATADIQALKAPLDYTPKTANITLTVPAGTDPSGCCVTIDPEENIKEITRQNNIVVIP